MKTAKTLRTIRGLAFFYAVLSVQLGGGFQNYLLTLGAVVFPLALMIEVKERKDREAIEGEKITLARCLTR